MNRLFAYRALAALCLFPVLMGVECDRQNANTAFVYEPPVPRPPATPGIEFFFREDGTEGSRGILEPGSAGNITYDLARFEACEPDEPGFQALAFVRPVGGDWVEHPLTATTDGVVFPLVPRIFIPSASRLEFSFFASNDRGCSLEDPADSRTYSFPVAFNRPRSILEFGASGGPTIKGVLASESAITVSFPVERLSQCRAQRNGTPTWRVEVEYTINQITDSVGLTALFPDDEVRETPGGFILPPATTVLELRFVNRDHTGCEQVEPPRSQPGFRVDVQ